MGIALFQAGETEVFLCTLAAKMGMWLGRAMPPPPDPRTHGTPQPVPPRCQSAFPKSCPPPTPPRGVFHCRCGWRESEGGGGGSPARMPSPRPPARPALPCPEAARMSLLTPPPRPPPLWLLLVWPHCCFNFSNSLERVIFHNSARSEALCLPALPSHTCCWRAPAAHACTCPARPACPSLLHTKASHPAPVPPLARFILTLPNSVVARLKQAPWPGNLGPSCLATPVASASSGVIVHSTRGRLSSSPCRPRQHV